MDVSVQRVINTPRLQSASDVKASRPNWVLSRWCTCWYVKPVGPLMILEYLEERGLFFFSLWRACSRILNSLRLKRKDGESLSEPCSTFSIWCCAKWEQNHCCAKFSICWEVCLQDIHQFLFLTKGTLTQQLPPALHYEPVASEQMTAFTFSQHATSVIICSASS